MMAAFSSEDMVSSEWAPGLGSVVTSTMITAIAAMARQ